MYEQHWRLNQPAFRSSGSAQFFYPSRSHEAAVLKLRYLVEQRQGIAVLTGNPGSGKTCVIDAFCEQLPSGCGPVVPIWFPQLTSAELLGLLTSKLESGDETGSMVCQGLDHVLQRLEGQLLQLTQAGRHPLIVIDDAHLIADRRVWQTLQLLLNYRRADRIDFSILLSGQPEVVGQIKRYGSLLDRLAFVSSLSPLEPDETIAYIRHRLQAAGGSVGIFEESALTAIHEHSGGNPRRINRLCDFALLVGYADNLDQVSAEQIEAVSEELMIAA